MFDIISFLKIKSPDNERKKLFVESIINSSSPNFDFYIMVSLSAIITSMGLIVDNIALVMAGMIVAPLLSPLLAIALGFAIFGPQMIYRSAKILVFSTVLSMFFSMLTGMIFNVDVENILLLAKMDISWLNFSIAITAGIIASYSWTKQNAKDYLSGVAIAVTIIPPLAIMGLAIADSNLLIFRHVSFFFLLNILGIFLSALLIFILMNFRKSKRMINKEIEKEEDEINNS